MTQVLEHDSPRWQIRTAHDDGFEFGLDEVTATSWVVVRSKKVGRAQYSYALPEPSTDAYSQWLKEHQGKVVVASVRELRSTIQGLQASA